MKLTVILQHLNGEVDDIKIDVERDDPIFTASAIERNGRYYSYAGYGVEISSAVFVELKLPYKVNF